MSYRCAAETLQRTLATQGTSGAREKTLPFSCALRLRVDGSFVTHVYPTLQLQRGPEVT